MIEQTQLANLLIDQSKDLYWIINTDFQLIYVNKRYQSLIKKITGIEHKAYDSAFIEYFGEAYHKKWKGFYTRALNGEIFEVEDHHFNPETNGIQFGLNTLTPLKDDDNKVFAVSCHSKDVTPLKITGDIHLKN
jgi:PAS domain-containing protein